MIVKHGFAKNFGSYKTFVFDFSQTGLHLISGPNGSGKSTVCDLIPWTLFGKTAKNGLASEIVSWNADGDTEASVIVTHKGKVITVTRKRGKSSDLFYQISDKIIRGKDVTDTQRMLNHELGLTPDQFLVSAYYHELSPSAQFFTTTAKNRRQITEQLVDLKEVTEAQNRFTDKIKATKADLVTLKRTYDAFEVNLIMAQKTLVSTETRAHQWDLAQGRKLNDLENKAMSFDSDKEQQLSKLDIQKKAWDIDNELNMVKIENALRSAHDQMVDARIAVAQLEAKKECLKHGETCPACGSKQNSSELEIVSDELMIAMHLLNDITTKCQNFQSSLEMQQTIKNPHISLLEAARNLQNPYLVPLQIAMSEETNPHLEPLADQKAVEEDLSEKTADARAKAQTATDDLRITTIAKESADTVRKILIETAMNEVEAETNRLMTKHFDSVMRIEFKAEQFDDLDVLISKDGNSCSYTQLSKGQRQLLKLCFAIACMKTTANRSNIKLEQIFFDEALDGLDEEMKTRSFSLLEELSCDYDSIYVVEHSSELKTMFTSAFVVSSTDGSSKIEKVI